MLICHLTKLLISYLLYFRIVLSLVWINLLKFISRNTLWGARNYLPKCKKQMQANSGRLRNASEFFHQMVPLDSSIWRSLEERQAVVTWMECSWFELHQFRSLCLEFRSFASELLKRATERGRDKPCVRSAAALGRMELALWVSFGVNGKHF